MPAGKWTQNIHVHVHVLKIGQKIKEACCSKFIWLDPLGLWYQVLSRGACNKVNWSAWYNACSFCLAPIQCDPKSMYISAVGSRESDYEQPALYKSHIKLFSVLWGLILPILSQRSICLKLFWETVKQTSKIYFKLWFDSTKIYFKLCFDSQRCKMLLFVHFLFQKVSWKKHVSRQHGSFVKKSASTQFSSYMMWYSDWMKVFVSRCVWPTKKLTIERAAADFDFGLMTVMWSNIC